MLPRSLPSFDRSRENTLALIRLIPYGAWNPDVGREVVAELVARGESALPWLAMTLADRSSPRLTRATIPHILSRIPGPVSRAVLDATRSDPDLEVARAVREALARGRGSAVLDLVPARASMFLERQAAN